MTTDLIAPQEETLELLFRPAAAGVASHAFIVYTDKDGVKWMFSGFPENEGAIPPFFGNLKAEFRPIDTTNKSNYDFNYYDKLYNDENSETISYTIASNEELDGINVVGLLGNLANSINKLSLDYNAAVDAQNSNSAAAAALRLLGLEDSLLTLSVPFFDPGINNDLEEAIENAKFRDWYNSNNTTKQERENALADLLQGKTPTEILDSNNAHVDKTNNPNNTPDYQLGNHELLYDAPARTSAGYNIITQLTNNGVVDSGNLKSGYLRDQIEKALLAGYNENQFKRAA